MSLPDFNAYGDLPPGVYRVTMEDVISRFGCGTEARQNAATILKNVFNLAKNTGHLEQIVIFGSFVTAKPMPNDVDLVLVMDDEFQVENCDNESAAIFDHGRAETEIGASVFWIRPGLLIADTLQNFVPRWQRKREGGERGIVEVMND